jgi:hypothetical protein
MPLIRVHSMGVPLIRAPLMDAPLMDVPLIRVYFIGVPFHGHARHGRPISIVDITGIAVKRAKGMYEMR